MISLVPLKILVGQGILITSITRLLFMVGVATLSLTGKYCQLASASLRSHGPYWNQETVFSETFFMVIPRGCDRECMACKA